MLTSDSEVATTERPASANGLKRRASEVTEGEQESKKQRISQSPGKTSPPAAKSDTTTKATAAEKTHADTTGEPHGTPIDSSSGQPAQKSTEKSPDGGPRRKSNVTDEKQRSRRLFGALLGNLSRPTDKTSKKRREIEERRKAELQRQDDARVEDKARRLEELAAKRKRVQVDVDRENMRIRHAQMLNAANFLQTNCEPKLYYRPWELRPDEEDRIDDQLDEAEAKIAEEVAEFEKRHSAGREQDQKAELEAHDEDMKDGDHAVPADAAEQQNDRADPPESGQNNTAETEGVHNTEAVTVSDDPGRPAGCTEASTTAERAAQGDQDGIELDHEENDDHVMEGEEDTVIY